MCPDGWDCLVVCEGHDRCKDAELRCPSANRCDVECTGDSACEGALVVCADGPCNAGCDDTKDVCKGMTLQCGAGAGVLECVGTSPVPTVAPDTMSVCACQAVGC